MFKAYVCGSIDEDYLCTNHLQVDPQTDIKPCDSVEMKVTVTNIGAVVGSEVVQIYVTFQVRCTYILRSVYCVLK